MAQSNIYHPLLDSSAGWKCMSGGYTVDDCKSYQFLITGDTSIQGIIYHKIQKSGVKYEMNIYGNCTFNVDYYFDFYAGAYRNDSINKKVYFVKAGTTQDTLLYDYNYYLQGPLTASFLYNPAWGNYIVASVDSILIGSQYRKRFGISANGDLFAYQIEGIGSTKGLLEPIRREGDHYTELYCFEQNGIVVYPDTSYASHCLIYTGTDNKELSKRNMISPSIIETNAKIILPNEEINVELAIFNTLGQPVFRMINIRNQEILKLSKLSTGLYFYILVYNEKIIGQGKLIKK